MLKRISTIEIAGMDVWLNQLMIRRQPEQYRRFLVRCSVFFQLLAEDDACNWLRQFKLNHGQNAGQGKAAQTAGGLWFKTAASLTRRDFQRREICVEELCCGPLRLLKRHDDAVIGVFHRASLLDRDARKHSVERTERHDGVG